MMELPGTRDLQEGKVWSAGASLETTPKAARQPSSPSHPPRTNSLSSWSPSTSSSSPGDRLVRDKTEKARVLSVMKAFAAKAFRGIDAHLLDGGRLKRVRYVLSSDLSQLVFEAEGMPVTSSPCAIGDCRSFSRGSHVVNT